MRPLDHRLLRYARRAAVHIAVLAVLGAITAGLVIAEAALLATAIADRTVTVLVPLAAVIAARALASWASGATAHRASAAATSELRRRLLTRVIGLGPAWRRAPVTSEHGAGEQGTGEHDAGEQGTGKRGTAELAELATRGIDALGGYFTGYLPNLVLAIAVPLAVLATIAAADPLSGIVVAVTLPLVPLFGALIGLATGRLAKERWQALGTLAHHFLDVTSGLPTLKVFGRATTQREQIAKVTDRYRRATMAALRLAFLSSFALELIATMSVALVATEIGLRLAYGHLDLRTGLLVLILAPEAYLPLRALGTQFHATADGLAAAGEVFAVLETPAPDPSAITARSGGTPRPGCPVEVAGVTVRHEGRADPAPRDATLTIVPGRLTVLIGPSGCGKSTLLECILGFRTPDSGTITPRLALSDIGWLPQDPALFSGTVAANIRLGWPDAPDAAVASAAREAALDDVRLDVPAGERGAGLSAGQRRRVALARALLVRRPVLLLDEPTAGLDAAREAAVLRTLRGCADAGAAVLAVSHRPAVIAAADDVVDIGDGAEAAAGRSGDGSGAGLPVGAPA
jgi:ATP-binding cassette subfamily C protein CydCD